MKKVLIITYYWPPKGGGGVQRWLKFVKYIRNYGWEPIIYTPDGGGTPVTDESLSKQIPENVETLKTPIWEPFDVYNKLMGSGKKKNYSGLIVEGKKANWKSRLAMWIRGNLFIPDARKYWIKPSIKFLIEYLKNNKVDAIVSTGPPHSMHIIAMGVKKKMNIPWIADFRDPWTNIDFYDELRLSSWADKKHRKLEKAVLKNADRVVCVTPNWAKDFERIGGRKIDVITNGYDPEDFSSKVDNLSDKFSIVHVGSMNKDRNPKILWDVLKNCCASISSFKEKLEIKLIGQVDFSIVESIKSAGLTKNLKQISFLPHSEVTRELQRSQILLLPINNTPNIAGVVPGKLFEYLGARRPILCIGSLSGDAVGMLKECALESVFDFNDNRGVHDFINSSFKQFSQGKLNFSPKNPEQFSRANLIGQFCELLNQVTQS